VPPIPSRNRRQTTKIRLAALDGDGATAGRRALCSGCASGPGREGIAPFDGVGHGETTNRPVIARARYRPPAMFRVVDKHRLRPS